MVTLLFSFLSISDRDIYSIFYRNRQEFELLFYFLPKSAGISPHSSVFHFMMRLV